MEQKEIIKEQEIIDPIKEERSNLGWYVFIGCMFIGMGVGRVFHHTDTGILIGMGVGFIAYAILSYKKG